MTSAAVVPEFPMPAEFDREHRTRLSIPRPSVADVVRHITPTRESVEFLARSATEAAQEGNPDDAIMFLAYALCARERLVRK